MGRLAGLLRQIRDGDAVAYEFELPKRFEPRPRRTRVERTFVLLDLGVSFADVCWVRVTEPDGAVVTADPGGDGVWYVDLVSVTPVDGGYGAK